MDSLTAAIKFAEIGISCIPVNSYDSNTNPKRPTVPWKKYQTCLPTREEISNMFASHKGSIAAIASGIYCLDIDEKYNKTSKSLIDKLMDKLILIGSEYIIKKALIQSTPSGGRHLIYRREAKVVGSNKKLAMASKAEVIYETREDGGYFLVSPSSGYTVLAFTPENPTKFSKLNTITEDEIGVIEACCKLSHYEGITIEGDETMTNPELRPGDDFNLRCEADKTILAKILRENGWSGDNTDTYWTRPGKDPKHGVSATLGAEQCGNHGMPFYVFSSSTTFDSSKAYTPFSVFCKLVCSGDAKIAAGKLRSMGYGGERKVEKEDLCKNHVDTASSVAHTVDKSQNKFFVEITKGSKSEKIEINDGDELRISLKGSDLAISSIKTIRM